MSTESDRGDAEKSTEQQVHSANSWETADLGDKQRNEKFLRLMGAGKKEHHGKIVIGDHQSLHKRERQEEKHLANELEEQYEHSLEYRMASGRRGHLGLGYHPELKEKQGEGGGNVEEVGVEAKGEEGEEKEAEEAGILAPTEEHKNVASNESSHSCTKEDDNNREKDERKRESSDDNSEPGMKKMKFVKSDS